MKQHHVLLITSVVAVLLSFVIAFRAFSVRADFDRSVKESLKTTEGYDQRFIDRVNHLEELLATRAKFGYTGGKDPMTGTTRKVVQAAPAAAPRGKTSKAVSGSSPEAPPVSTDQVKLTAIIADAAGKKITAIIMDGERSYSVDPGDLVAGRRITRITNDGIYMETDTMQYFYDIYGNVATRSKESGTVTPLLKEEENAREPPKKPAPPAHKR